MLLGISVFVLTVVLIVCVVLLVMCNQKPQCIKLDASKEFEKDFKELNLKVNTDPKVVYKQNEYLINFVYSDDKLKKLFQSLIKDVNCFLKLLKQGGSSKEDCLAGLRHVSSSQKEILLVLVMGISKTIKDFHYLGPGGLPPKSNRVDILPGVLTPQ